MGNYCPAFAAFRGSFGGRLFPTFPPFFGRRNLGRHFLVDDFLHRARILVGMSLNLVEVHLHGHPALPDTVPLHLVEKFLGAQPLDQLVGLF